jgi:hypothetical protein
MIQCWPMKTADKATMSVNPHNGQRHAGFQRLKKSKVMIRSHRHFG